MNKSFTPLKAIRKYCVNNCMNGKSVGVKFCSTDGANTLEKCFLYDLRFGKNPLKLNIIKQIRENCLACSAFKPKEVINCAFTDCELYPYRMGKNPNKKGSNSKHMKKMRNKSSLKIKNLKKTPLVSGVF